MAKQPEIIPDLDKKIDRMVLKRVVDVFRGIANNLERELKALEGGLPYRGMRASKAIEMILRKAKDVDPNSSMTSFELRELLVEGGSAIGETDDPQGNTNRAIKQGANEGYLIILEDGTVTVPEQKAVGEGQK
jgi:hypothetical protein